MLPVPDGVFTTTSGRSWWIGEDMAYLPLGYCFAAAIPALVLTILVYFDHNVSSVLSQRKEFGLKKAHIPLSCQVKRNPLNFF